MHCADRPPRCGCGVLANVHRTSDQAGGFVRDRQWRDPGQYLAQYRVRHRREASGHHFSRGENCAAWSVSSAVGDVREDATTAWNIETTAIRVVRDAITFRLRWVRYAALRQQFDQIPLESSKAFRIPNEDIELTMRPGESAVVDTVRVPAGLKTMEGRRAEAARRSECQSTTTRKRRRIGGWLRPTSGSSSGSPMALRRNAARFCRCAACRTARSGSISTGSSTATSHSISSGSSPRGSRVAPRRSPLRRAVDGGSANSPGFYGPQQFVESAVVVKPEEIVEVRLPKLDADAGPFAGREFSIRIRARQLR